MIYIAETNTIMVNRAQFDDMVEHCLIDAQTMTGKGAFAGCKFELLKVYLAPLKSEQPSTPPVIGNRHERRKAAATERLA